MEVLLGILAAILLIVLVAGILGDDWSSDNSHGSQP